MREWTWAVVAAVAAGLGAMAADLGVTVWSGLVAAGVLVEPTCNDVVLLDAGSSALAACVRPASMTLIAMIATLGIALIAALTARALASRFDSPSAA